MKRIFTSAIALLILTICAFAQEPVRKTYDFDNFTGIRAGFIHKIHVTEGRSNKVEVTCPEKYAEYMNYNVFDGTLNLDMNFPNTWKKWNIGDAEIVVNVQMEKITNISLSGSAELTAEGDFAAKDVEISLSGASRIKDTLHIKAYKLEYELGGTSRCAIKGVFSEAKGEISGVSSLTLDGNVNDFEVEVRGASSVILKGETENIDIECSGASKVDAEKMIAENARAVANGASSVKVYGSKKLDLECSAASGIKYYGEAQDIRVTSKNIVKGE